MVIFKELLILKFIEKNTNPHLVPLLKLIYPMWNNKYG